MLKGLLKLSAAVAAVGAGYAILSKRATPASITARAVNAVKVQTKSTNDYDNGVALTPPMGWSSWNLFRNKINEELILEIANTMKVSGLADAGYIFVNLDDCWQSTERDAAGRMQGDLTNFPRGIKPLVDDINKMGLKVGIYSSNGSLTCEDMPASLGNEAIDAKTFADWGIEYFKYDFCHNNPVTTSAPNIEKISLGNIGGNDFLTLDAEEATLSDHARLMTEPNREGRFIGGMSGNLGAATFYVEVPDDDEYVLTVGLRKFGPYHKYAQVSVNESEVYEFVSNPTKGFTADGRQQLIVKLAKGENTLRFYNPVGSRMDGAAMQYINMGKELKKATKAVAEESGKPEKPIVYSICEWGMNRPWKWGKEGGNLWRTTPDIKPFWSSIVTIYEVNVRLAKYAGIGGWNDPDMLEVGNGELTDTENKAHFALWCMMAAPLILGNDIRSFIKEDGTVDTENETYKIVTDKDLIAIDQDPLGVQCRRFKTNGKVDVLVKPLANREIAVCFFNKFGDECTESVSLKDIADEEYVALPESDSYDCTELWLKETENVRDELCVSLQPHSVKIYRVKAAK